MISAAARSRSCPRSPPRTVRRSPQQQRQQQTGRRTQTRLQPPAPAAARWRQFQRAQSLQGERESETELGLALALQSGISGTAAGCGIGAATRRGGPGRAGAKGRRRGDPGAEMPGRRGGAFRRISRGNCARFSARFSPPSFLRLFRPRFLCLRLCFVTALEKSQRGAASRSANSRWETRALLFPPCTHSSLPCPALLLAAVPPLPSSVVRYYAGMGVKAVEGRVNAALRLQAPRGSKQARAAPPLPPSPFSLA